MNDESNDRLLIDNLMTAALAGDSAQVDAARIALRRRCMALRSACATGLQPPAEEQIEAAWVAFNRTRTRVGEGTPEFLRRCVAEAVSAAWSAQTRHSEQNRPQIFVANTNGAANAAPMPSNCVPSPVIPAPKAFSLADAAASCVRTEAMSHRLRSIVPQSPGVAVAMWTSHPASLRRMSVPAQRISASSG